MSLRTTLRAAYVLAASRAVARARGEESAAERTPRRHTARRRAFIRSAAHDWIAAVVGLLLALETA